MIDIIPFCDVAARGIIGKVVSGEKGEKSMKGRRVESRGRIEHRTSNKKNAWGKPPPCKTNKTRAIGPPYKTGRN